MEAFELEGVIDNRGKLIIDHLLPIQDKKVKVLLLVEKDLDVNADMERGDLIQSSIIRLQEAYGESEPEYTLDMIREWNPKYKPHE